MPELILGRAVAGGELVTLDTDADRYQAEGLRLGLFASSGAGKGYLLGVLLEELIGAGYPVIMVDPESELWTFRELGALVVGGQHGHVPFDPTAAAAIEASLSFALETATPLVFDLDGLSPNEVRAAFDAIAEPYWSLINQVRRPSALAITEAHLVAPEKLPRGAADSELLPRIQSGGRKRGAITIVETQRMADIANDVIAHCNVRFVGRVDFEDDFRRVARGLPRGVDFATVSVLERGQFYAPRLSPDVIQVRERRVTHGGSTPDGTAIQLRKTATPKALADVAKRLSSLIAQAAPARPDDSDVDGRGNPAASAQARRRRGRRDASLERRSDAPAAGPGTSPILARLVEVEQERDEARATVERLSAEHLATTRRLQARIAELEEAARAATTVRNALTALLGPGGGQVASPGLSEDRVLALIRQHAPAASAGPALRPVEALRAEYLERTAQRLVATVRELAPDEREALLFHVAHPGMQTLNAVARALSGSDSGSVRARWSKAVQALAAKGLLHTAQNGTRRANLEPWVASNLAPHSPTDQEAADVVERALSVVMVEDA